MSLYNPERLHEQILSHHSDSPPSFTIHFYQEHWLINNSRPNLYHTPISFLLDDIRERRIPTDWLPSLDQHGTTFYEGCLIIELVDHRVAPGTSPTRERVLLPPNAETLWADICLQQERSGKILTEDMALDIEARLLAATSGPLCLDPDPLITRIANTALRSSVMQPPAAFKAKDDNAENSRGDAAKARQVKLMSLMNPHPSGSMSSSRLYEFLMRRGPTGVVPFQNQEVNTIPAVPVATLPHAAAPNPPSIIAQNSDLKKAKKKSEPSETPQPPEHSELESNGVSGKTKRKASTSSVLQQPTQPAKKKAMKKASESAEPSPIPTIQQLPPNPPQPTAYQLPPSTGVTIQSKKQQTMNKKATVKKEPSTQPLSYPSPVPQPSVAPLANNQSGGVMLNHPPMQQVPMLPQQTGAARPKSETPTPMAPTPQPHPTQQFPQHPANAILFQQRQQQYQQHPQTQSQPQTAPSPSVHVQSTPVLNPAIPPQFQQGTLQQQQQQSALNMNIQQLNRAGGLRVNPHGQALHPNAQMHLQHMASMGMAMPSQAQSPFQQPAHAPSPQSQHRSSPLPTHSRVPSRPPSSQQVNPPPQQPQQPQFTQAPAQGLHQRQLTPAQPQQPGVPLASNPNFQLQLPMNLPGGVNMTNGAVPGMPAAGWRMNRAQLLHQQQLNALAQNGGIPQGMGGMGRGQMSGQGR